MKVFISTVTVVRSGDAISAERKVIKEAIKSRLDSNVEFVESNYQDRKPRIALKSLAHSLELLADADVAVFGIGWEHDRTCVIEHRCAVDHGIKVMYMDFRRKPLI